MPFCNKIAIHITNSHFSWPVRLALVCKENKAFMKVLLFGRFKSPNMLQNFTLQQSLNCILRTLACLALACLLASNSFCGSG